MSENNYYNSSIIMSLIDNNISIASAESCTGGLFASTLTKYNGVSKIFPGSIVSYSNDIKQKLLGVTPETLKEYGAVSSQTVSEMARGIRKVMGTDLGVSFSGIAGPTKEIDAKPQGLVYICVDYKGKQLIVKNNFKGTREIIQQMSVDKSFQMINEIISFDWFIFKYTI